MEQPRFTIVTISFNQAKFLPRAIESVLAQRSESVEYIVVDPGSTDGSRDVIASYGTDIDVAILEPDAGPTDGLQKAFARATGRFYGCINSDDALLPGALRRVGEAFDLAPRPDVVLGGGYLVDGEGRATGLIVPTPLSSRYFGLKIMEFLQQSTFVSAEAFHRVGGYNLENRTSWDCELMIDLARSGVTARRVFEPGGIFTLHDEGITGSGRLAEQADREAQRLIPVALGREMRASDRALFPLARAYKLVRYPAITARKAAFAVTTQRRRAPLAPLVPAPRQTPQA
ncbi:MAG: glycosyltransferase [Sporichthyaceae bacterium]